MNVVWVEACIIFYSAANKQSERLYHLISFVQGKGTNTWPILNVVYLGVSPGYVRKVRYDLRLKMVQIKYW